MHKEKPTVSSNNKFLNMQVSLQHSISRDESYKYQKCKCCEFLFKENHSTIRLHYTCQETSHDMTYCINCASKNRLCIYDSQPLDEEYGDELREAVAKYYGKIH